MTKAKSRGAKINAKRGRRRIEGVEREPNGRVSRAKHPPSKLALEARARMNRITIEQAKDQKAGTFLGLLHMAYVEWEKHEKSKIVSKCQPDQSLSTAQYHALLTCQELHNDYLKAVGAPGAQYDPHLGNSGDDDAHARWCENVKERWVDVQKAIYAAQESERSSNLWAALDLCVFQERYFPHMTGTLKLLGNALSRHFQRT